MALRLLEATFGLLILTGVYYDLFQSVVLPRPSVGKLRLSPLVLRPFWSAWRWVGNRIPRLDRRENWLGTFGPIALIMLLSFWVAGLVIGFTFLINSMRDQLQPPEHEIWSSLYFSAGTLFPLSYGEIYPVGLEARVVTVAESATGVGLIALVISLLFSLYGSFQAREQMVVTLDALAGAPPSGLQILETVAKYRMPDELQATFDDWRKWSAAVLESHLAYPILLYFRSSHDNEAWVNSFGAVLDAASLVISTLEVEDAVVGHARLMFKVGNHLVEDVSWYLGFRNAKVPLVERDEFEDARQRLLHAGYRCRDADPAWNEFAALRSLYASPLNQLGQRLAIQPAAWMGDRSYLPHVRRQARPRRRLTGRPS